MEAYLPAANTVIDEAKLEAFRGQVVPDLGAIIGAPENGERRARAAFWEEARSMARYVSVEPRGLVFLLPTEIDAKLFVDGGKRSDLVVLERACAVLRDSGRLVGGETFVDTGAHVGTTTIPAVVHHGFGRAVAIEPDPDNLRLLRANVALNGLDERVIVIAAALSDKRQQQQPFVQGSRKGGVYRWMKGRLSDEPSSNAVVSVETITLDALAEAGSADAATAGVLWFDCAGCQERALRSASVFLERRVPLVLTLRPRQFREPTPLFAQLRATYEHVIDLRIPRLADPVSAWTPTFRPVDDLAALPEAKKLTDVLVF
jgi:FkbM family methyltransferase